MGYSTCSHGINTYYIDCQGLTLPETDESPCGTAFCRVASGCVFRKLPTCNVLKLLASGCIVAFCLTWCQFLRSNHVLNTFSAICSVSGLKIRHADKP